MALFAQSAPPASKTASGNTGSFLFGGATNGAANGAQKPLFGANSTATSTLAPANSTGASSLVNPTSTAATSTLASIPKSNLGGSTVSNSKLLKDLIESANNLPKTNNHDLGTIHLTLSELQRKSNELRKRKDDNTNFTKAHYLLASSGISAEEIENDLKSIDLPTEHQHKTFNKVTKPKQYVGVDQFLNTKKEENILNTIEQSLVAASKDFDAFINRTITIDWRARRNELKKSLSLNQGVGSDKASNSIKWNQSVPGNYSILAPLSVSSAQGQTKVPSTPSSSRQYTREKFEKYATVTYQLNEARLHSQFFPLFLSYEELTKSSSDLKSKQITAVYKILIELTNEQTSKINLEQKFFTSYQGVDTAEKSKLNELITKKSKTYLESQFLHYVDEIYNKEDNKADFVPSTNINKIKFFINKVVMKNNADFNNKTLKVNGIPIWALIFYLMRSGLYSDALHLVISNNEIFDKFDKNFPLYLKKFLENGSFKLPIDLNDRLQSEFSQQFSFINENLNNLFDPYKYSVYKIIGKCDLSKRSLPAAINLSMEDWLWFHLSILNESSINESSLIYENYSLVNLQKKIIQLGSRKLNSSSNNPMYLKCLVMVGLYELAVQYTYEFLSEIDSVHLAIGLNYYGLLKVSNINKDELIYLSPTTNEYEINFSRLIGSFTRTFKISDPKVACQYLILIAISKGGESKEEIAKCHEALRELILISREFTLLLGELNSNNGEKVSGLLEKQRNLINLPALKDFYNRIIEISAKKCEEEGRVFDSLLLYQLSQDYDTVLVIINKILSELIATTELDKSLIKHGNYENINGETKGEDTIENNIILLSEHIIKTFNNNSSIISQIDKSLKESCELLLSIVNIREQFLGKNFNKVLLEIENLNLLPIKPSDDIIDIRKAAEFVQHTIDSSVIKVIPSLLVITMTSVSQLNYQILTKTFKSLNNGNDELARFKKIAKNCMIFAGMIQYKMPRETYSLLIQLESRL